MALTKMSFRDKIYELTRQIPKGKIATYGQLARLAGKPKAARAVGLFMRLNPDPAHVPCHRVVGANGSLVGYSAKEGIVAKKKLLMAEGVKFRGDKAIL